MKATSFFVACLSACCAVSAQADSKTNVTGKVAQPASSTNEVARATAGSNTVAMLAPVVVTASRIEESATDVPRTIVTVSKQSMREKQITKPSDALNDEPGIWVQKTGQVGGTPIIRGMMGNTVLYMVDGIRINNGRTYTGPSPIFNQLDIGGMDSVEIMKGPGAVQYGSDAMGGVINVTLPKTDYFSDTTKVSGKASAQYSSADNGLVAHTEGRLVSTNVNAAAGVTYAHSGNVRTGGGDKLEDMDYTSYGAFAKVSALLYPGNVVSLGYMENVMTDIERYDQSARNAYSGDPRYFTPVTDRRILYLKDSIDIKDAWISHVEPYVYWQEYYGKSEQNSDKNATTFIQNNSEDIQNQYGAGLTAESQLIEDELKLVYGADYRYEYARTFSDRMTWNVGSSPVYSEPAGKTPNGMYDVGDAFLMAIWDATDSWRLNAGLRFESTHLESRPGPQDPTAGLTQDDLDLNKRWNAVTYEVGSVYKITDELSWTADGSTGFRSPTYSDVLNYGGFTYGYSVPNPDVDPEKCVSAETGLRWNSEDVSASLVGYGTYLYDTMTRLRESGYTDVNGNGREDAAEHNYAKQNYGEGYICGVEASGEWRFFKQWALFGNLTWTDGWDDKDEEPWRFIPPLYGIGGLRYEPTDWMKLSLFARAAAAQTRVTTDDKSDPARATDPAYTYPSDTNPPLRPDYSIPGWITYNARADFKVSKYGSLFVGLENFTDHHYRVAFNRQDAAGICATVGAEVLF